MHTKQLRQADLNLLIVFAVMAEERSISRAAVRLGLTQPAMSRAMQRAREMFRDDLMVRTKSGFKATPLGQRLLRELELMLPRLDQLLSGSGFDPTREELTFRITATDYGSSLVCEHLSRDSLPRESKVTFQFVPRSENEFEALEHGQVDLVLHADDGKAPANLCSQALFRESFVCVVAIELPFASRITFREYLLERHIGMSGAQTLLERSLATAGLKRNCAVIVPYFTAAISAVAGTNFIATVPRRIAEQEVHRPGIKILQAPKEFKEFRYMMYWHTRMNTDASHIWLRSVITAAGDKIKLT